METLSERETRLANERNDSRRQDAVQAVLERAATVELQHGSLEERTELRRRLVGNSSKLAGVACDHCGVELVIVRSRLWLAGSPLRDRWAAWAAVGLAGPAP